MLRIAAAGPLSTIGYSASGVPKTAGTIRYPRSHKAGPSPDQAAPGPRFCHRARADQNDGAIKV